MNINIDALIAQDYFRTLTYMLYSTLAQNIELLKANLLGSVHIPLGGRKTLWRHIEGSIAGNRFF